MRQKLKFFGWPMSEESDSVYSMDLPIFPEDDTLFQPIPYIPKDFELSPHSVFLDSDPDSLRWEYLQRTAQIQALVLMHDHWGNGIGVPILEYPWSDAKYFSLVKIWGIDHFDEDSAFYLDQVWLLRWDPDTPHQWLVIAATTDEKPLSGIRRDDGVWVEEGTRDYLDEILAQMLTSSDQYVRLLSATLTRALKSYQLRYRHLHSVHNPQTGELHIDEYDDFPIYPSC
jgi:hypothetical protein